ncbi:hypothetical protein Hanom_Chr06g00498601 [Helianthus anomalus]
MVGVLASNCASAKKINCSLKVVGLNIILLVLVLLSHYVELCRREVVCTAAMGGYTPETWTAGGGAACCHSKILFDHQ